uniref:RRM domain-containing protein n=1 Tax=Zea mays TaxID=4577 RepID=C4J2T8_MAIZE|nr:unknown [Zea mays]
MAASDVEYRCFVGGLAWATDDHSLNNAFSTYGEVLESKVRSVPFVRSARSHQIRPRFIQICLTCLFSPRRSSWIGRRRGPAASASSPSPRRTRCAAPSRA